MFAKRNLRAALMAPLLGWGKEEVQRQEAAAQKFLATMEGPDSKNTPVG